MSVQSHERETVESVFRAMQQGPEGETLMMSLFNDDAVFIEPFGGAPRTHTGSSEIRAAFLANVAEAPPDIALTLDRLDKEGEQLKAAWTCTSSVFPGPMRGYDLFDLKNGKIQRLEIAVTEMPDFGEGHH